MTRNSQKWPEKVTCSLWECKGADLKTIAKPQPILSRRQELEGCYVCHFWKGWKAQASAWSVSGKGPGLQLKPLLVFQLNPLNICSLHNPSQVCLNNYVSFFMADRNTGKTKGHNLYNGRGGNTKNHPFFGGITKTRVPIMGGGSQNHILGYHKIKLLVSMIYKISAATPLIIHFFNKKFHLLHKQ